MPLVETRKKVLIIEDDRVLSSLVSDYLGASNIDVKQVYSGEQGLSHLKESEFDAVLLDMMLPGIDGLTVLRKIRDAKNVYHEYRDDGLGSHQLSHDVPVIILTARGDEADRVAGLELGADDYLSKPFSPRELLARLRAVWRRTISASDLSEWRLGPLRIEQKSRLVFLDHVRMDLTGIEFDLLLTLLKKQGRVVSRESLLRGSGRHDIVVGDRTVDVHVSHLRSKLEANRSDHPPCIKIKTVRGLGYVLTLENG